MKIIVTSQETNNKELLKDFLKSIENMNKAFKTLPSIGTYVIDAEGTAGRISEITINNDIINFEIENIG